jgi:hypothetical protein
MWPFKSKSEEMTLKSRVQGFWKWYAQHAARFHAAIEAGNCHDLQPEVSAGVDRWLPGMAWVFGPGEKGAGHSFTLSGEGVLARQIVAEYWQSQAPRLEGWTFYAARQPSSNVREFSLQFGSGFVFEPKELWVHLRANDQEENIDITAWHPLFARVEDNSKYSIMFLLLDEVLGEHGTQNWIGEIKFADTQLKESVPIWELPEFIKQVETQREWKKYKPTDTYTSYRIPEPKDGLRGDIFVGTARLMKLVRDYITEEGPVEHPAPDLGLDFVFVALAREILPKGEEVEFRTTIEDDIVTALEENASGDSLGGASGTHHSYIDLVIYDGEQSIRQIMDVLKKHELPHGTAVHYFTKEKAGRVHRL